MKTLTEIKNNYAQEQGYEDWEQYFINHFATSQFSRTATLSVFENVMDKICIRAQKAALENAAENVKMKTKENISELSMMDDWSEIDRNSITNPENLIQCQKLTKPQ